MMIELLLTCVCACLAGISYRIWELNKTLKEILVMRQETEETTTFESVWKRYEPVEEPIRCKDCKYREAAMKEV